MEKMKEYVKPEQISEELSDAINKVIEYCQQHQTYEDCKICVLGDGIHRCACFSPDLWHIRNS